MLVCFPQCPYDLSSPSETVHLSHLQVKLLTCQPPSKMVVVLVGVQDSSVLLYVDSVGPIEMIGPGLPTGIGRRGGGVDQLGNV